MIVTEQPLAVGGLGQRSVVIRFGLTTATSKRLFLQQVVGRSHGMVLKTRSCTWPMETLVPVAVDGVATADMRRGHRTRGKMTLQTKLQKMLVDERNSARRKPSRQKSVKSAASVRQKNGRGVRRKIEND